MDEPRTQTESLADQPSRKPRFSILSMLLLLTVVAMGLALVLAHREKSEAKQQLAEQNQTLNFLKDEVGFIGAQDESKHCIRELENQIPLARRFLVDFPHGRYHVVVGDHLGGDFVPANLNRRHHSTAFLRMQSNLTIHVFINPSGETQWSVDILDFDSGRSGGGYLPDYEVDVNQLNYLDNQHGQAVDWRIGNDRPHGELMIYDSDVEFIPLFILKDGIKAKDDDGKFRPVKGLAVWIEPIRNNQ